MKKYKHNFKEGDIVTDTKHKEIFKFIDKRDGFRAEKNPSELRLSTEEEIKKLNDSGKDYEILV
jgi:hypothetical protein